MVARARLVAAVLGLLLVAACGDADDGTVSSTAAPTTAASTTDTSTSEASTTAAPTTGAPTTAGPTTEVPLADVVIGVALAGGEVTVDVSGVATDRVEVPVGSEVAIVVTSDIAEEVHVHGYDERLDVAEAADQVLVFTADIPGLFEVELEQSARFLLELEVS